MRMLEFTPVQAYGVQYEWIEEVRPNPVFTKVSERLCTLHRLSFSFFCRNQFIYLKLWQKPYMTLNALNSQKEIM